MKIKPLQDWVLVHPSISREKTSGGIYIPESAKEKPQEGKVVAVGKGRFEKEHDKKGKVTGKTFVKTTLHTGDRILYEKYAAVEVPVENEEIVMVREADVLGLLQA